MEYRILGKTGLLVSRFCLGTLTMGPLQRNLSLSEGARLISTARGYGVCFFDTAHVYRTYEYIKRAIPASDTSAVIASRSYAYSSEDMRKHLELALLCTGRERIEIFGLHEQESALTLAGHRDALEYLVRAKQDGKVGAILVSSHTVQGVLAAAEVEEVDVLHPLVNMSGIGVRGGSAEDMVHAIEQAHCRGKGIYAMKALGGGHLASHAYESLSYVRDLTCVDSVAVGASTVDEIEYNCAVLSGLLPRADVRARVHARERRVAIEDWCSGCGRCAEACSSGAISIEHGRASVDQEKCIMCGYCVNSCEGFFIKVM